MTVDASGTSQADVGQQQSEQHSTSIDDDYVLCTNRVCGRSSLHLDRPECPQTGVIQSISVHAEDSNLVRESARE